MASSDQQLIERLLKTPRSCLTICTFEETYVLEMLTQAAVALQRQMEVWSLDLGIVEGTLSDAPPIPNTTHPAAALTYWATLGKADIQVALDLAGHLDDERVLRCLRTLIETNRKSNSTLVLIDHRDHLPPVIEAYATPVEIPLPDEAELDQLIRSMLRTSSKEQRIQIEVTRAQYETMLKNLRGLTRRQAGRIIRDVVLEDHRLLPDDINRVMAEKRRMLHTGGLLEYIETPVDHHQIGGLQRLKSWLNVRQEALSDKAQALGLPAPRGVLLLGVQGAGKSLCAKAIATAWQRPLLRLDPGVLYDKFIGESERRLRDALKQAQAMAPLVLWVDEIEKGFASAASQNIDGGLSQRMFGCLLTWMQEHQSPVFVVATANNIEALPPELLRKGRFDEVFFVDLPGPDTRREIFAIHLRKRGHDPAQFDLDALAAAADGYSGAEIEQAVVAGLFDAFAAKATLDTGRVLAALQSSPPLSVTMAERVDALRAWAVGRCVPAD